MGQDLTADCFNRVFGYLLEFFDWSQGISNILEGRIYKLDRHVPLHAFIMPENNSMIGIKSHAAPIKINILVQVCILFTPIMNINIMPI